MSKDNESGAFAPFRRLNRNNQRVRMEILGMLCKTLETSYLYQIDLMDNVDPETVAAIAVCHDLVVKEMKKQL